MKNLRTFSLKSLLVATACVAVFVTWRIYHFEHATINDWIDAVFADLEVNPLDPDGWKSKSNVVVCQTDIPPDKQRQLLMKSLRWLPTSERRNCVLKIIAEQFPDEAHDLFIQISQRTDHELLKRNAILLSSIFRMEEDITYYESFLDNENRLVRSAAIDAIGVVHHPTFPMPAGFDDTNVFVAFESKPRINLRLLVDQYVQTEQGWRKGAIAWKDPSKRKLRPATKQKIQDLLLNDPDSEVRSAAARAARNWNPSDCKLRVAEWGVWINEGESLTLAQSIIDEIPPFVHQVGNDMASIKKGRTNSLIIVTKPIIHFSSDRPLVVDVSVKISAGRPWFGYPMPDDFATKGTTGQFRTPKKLPRNVPATVELDALDELSEGYPWLIPCHTKRYVTTMTDVGFRWQTLLVSPKKLDWMSLEPITDQKFAWWNRLRKVECSWVSNRGESERFLYYDGPTELASPVKASLESDYVKVAVPNQYLIRDEIKRTHLFLNFSNGKISATKDSAEFSKEKRSTELPIAKLPYQGEAVEEQLMEILIQYGLNVEEAKGLVDCWRPQFFETEGKRLLTIFGNVEYQNLCPISITPDPTELRRVGIVLTEFGTE